MSEIEFEFEEQEPILQSPGKKVPDKKKRQRPTGKWMIFGVGVLLLGVLVTAYMLHLSSDTTSAGDGKSTAIIPNEKDLEVGGKGTQAYNGAVITQTQKAADLAATSGKSYAPTPIGSDPVSTLKPEAPPAQKPAAAVRQQTQQEQQEMAAVKQAMKLSLDAIIAGMAMVPQSTMNFTNTNDAKAIETASGQQGQGPNNSNGRGVGNPDVTVASKTVRLPGGIHSGSILYAVNDLRLNSDAKNPVVRATVISGPLNHYTALGGFENGGESLSLVFTRLVSPEGVEYPVHAFGIDPSVPEANVASDVDYHYLSRWGGFMAASFLTGFADATRMSGTSSSGYGAAQNGINPSYGMMTIPTFSLMQKGAIAVGEVGRQAGQQLAAGIKRPPTVTLDAGMTLGILVVSADNSSGGK